MAQILCRSQVSNICWAFLQMICMIIATIHCKILSHRQTDKMASFRWICWSQCCSNRTSHNSPNAVVAVEVMTEAGEIKMMIGNVSSSDSTNQDNRVELNQEVDNGKGYFKID